MVGGAVLFLVACAGGDDGGSRTARDAAVEATTDAGPDAPTTRSWSCSIEQTLNIDGYDTPSVDQGQSVISITTVGNTMTVTGITSGGLSDCPLTFAMSSATSGTLVAGQSCNVDQRSTIYTGGDLQIADPTLTIHLSFTCKFPVRGGTVTYTGNGTHILTCSAQ